MTEGVSISTLLGSSKAMRAVRAFAEKAAGVDASVLILGETGTGKSHLGRVIHQASPRSSSPYLAINCAGIPDSLFESEFFGHRRGAFTGALEGRKGILEQAGGGTLFLDEVGELAVHQQAKLLTAIEDGEIRRLGSEGTVTVDVRVLAATSRDLAREMKKGLFRRDLFHRLAVLTLRLPPLRERREDIQLLARRFLENHKRRHRRPNVTLSIEARQYLEDHRWPGNVRELSHVLEAALILSDGDTVGLDMIRAAGGFSESQNGEGEEGASGGPGGEAGVDSGGSGRACHDRDGDGEVPERLRYSFPGSQEAERDAIETTLLQAGGNKSLAARQLGMARNTLRQKLRKYGLE